MAPAPRPRSRRCRALPAPLVGLGLAALLLAGCAGGSDAASDPTVPETTSPAPTAPAGTTSSSSSSSSSSAPSTTLTTSPPGDGVPEQPGSPSTLPPSVEGPCRALAETYGLDAIRPVDSPSWVDERQRVVVDARRERDLLEAARAGAPDDVAASLATMAAYAGWVADTVQSSGGYAEASSALAGYPERGAVDGAEAAVASWRATACP